MQSFSNTLSVWDGGANVRNTTFIYHGELKILKYNFGLNRYYTLNGREYFSFYATYLEAPNVYFYQTLVVEQRDGEIILTYDEPYLLIEYFLNYFIALCSERRLDHSELFCKVTLETCTYIQGSVTRFLDYLRGLEGCIRICK